LREISEARWSEIDCDKLTLTVPAERMKGKKAHTVPLTPAVVALLKTMPRFKGGDFVFTTTGGRRPVSGFSKAKMQLDKIIGEIDHWSIHDLRRTARTGLATVGASPFIAELVIGHRQTGVHATYDLYSYLVPKRDALLEWEKKLLAIVAPPVPGNVVPLRAGATA
jgi:integrase